MCSHLLESPRTTSKRRVTIFLEKNWTCRNCILKKALNGLSEFYPAICLPPASCKGNPF